MLTQYLWETPLGPLHGLVSERGLACTHMGSRGVSARFEAWRRRYAPREEWVVGTQHAEWEDQLGAYFERGAEVFTPALDLRGTPFRLRVWQALREIPRGQVRTYGEIARALGAPGASRAVGGANGANPIPVVVPCHRVVARTGLGGFSGPMEWKQGLLMLEGVCLPESGLQEPPDEGLFE